MRYVGKHHEQLLEAFFAGMIKTGSIEIETAGGHKFTIGDGSDAPLELQGVARGARASATARRSTVRPDLSRPYAGLRNKALPTRPATTAPEIGASQNNQS